MAKNFGEFKAQLKAVASKASTEHNGARGKAALENAIKPAVEDFLTQQKGNAFLNKFHVDTERTSPKNEINGELVLSVGVQLNDQDQTEVSFYVVCAAGGATVQEFVIPKQNKTAAKMMLSLTIEQAKTVADALHTSGDQQAQAIFKQIDGWLKSLS